MGNKQMLTAVLLFAILVTTVTFGSLFIDKSRGERYYWDVVGVVCGTGNCTIHYGARGGRWYDGIVVLCFEWEGSQWRVEAEPQAACGIDCCADLMQSAAPVWIDLDNDDPEEVANFFTDAAYYSGSYFQASIWLIVFAVGACLCTLFGCCTLRK